ncbi:OmpH family outer membrane protein [Psychroserpens mesophilus]|uniref:hypothetical protein n=1 Tax=Psychroserpens mesophilus TaxID=325473 RepID=UPI001362EAB3|nr:hypothetical protein [Psychroserpens mesophilus]
MTKEIMSIEENKMTLRKKALDSLLGLYNIVNDKTSIQAIDLQSKISIKNENLKTLQSEFSNTIPNKIWSRLNAYIKDYGKQKEVKIIFGISGNGNIMYADETNLDVTEELLKYINDRYEGKSLSL